MERDGCRLCGEAERDIQSLAGCLYSGGKKSDLECEEAPDLAPEHVISEKFRENWECLSENSTLFLLENLRPRAAFGGHTHFGCKKWWKNQYGFWEYTVPSFSWRNNRHPALLLLSVSPEQVAVARCFMPHEHTVVAIYGAFIFLWGAVLVFALANLYASRNRNKRVNKFVLVPDKLS
ncbi:metallophosphoesterase 1 [Aphelenchoides avenae]|nr:metallophosphoesterase 1 [Aphelenchus avenae]